MKFICLITCLFFLSVTSAQRYRTTKEVRLIDYELQSIVKSSKYLHYIKFDKSPVDSLIIRPDSSILGEKPQFFYKHYDLSYLGHKYLLEKEFGKFPANRLLKILDSLKKLSPALRFYDGKIYANHIQITETELYSDDPDEKIFIKIPQLAEYPGGQIAFQNFLQNKVNGSGFNHCFNKDTVFFFQATLKKDSLIHDTKLFDAVDSDFTNFVQTALKETSGWKPFIAGGRPAMKYLQVFLLLRKNGDIEADYY